MPGRLIDALVREPQHAALFAQPRELTAMIDTERAWLAATVAVGRAPAEALPAFDASVSVERLSLDELQAGVARDGVVVPTLVGALRELVGPPHDQQLHLGATSQDILDTALSLRLTAWLLVMDVELTSALARLAHLEAVLSGLDVTGTTRMQPALPVAWSHRVRVWGEPLRSAKASLAAVRGRIAVVQVGGPVGDRRGLGDDPAAFAAAFAAALGLRDPGSAWHTDRSRVLELAAWAARLLVGLSKIGTDIGLATRAGELMVDGAGRSSAMPHKRNPILAETVAALGARASQHLAALHAAHEGERSGRAWTLEQLVLPELCVDAGTALRLTVRLLASVRPVTDNRGS